jgi:hypothetical protein
MDATREGGLLAWQLREYPKGHRDRRNLLVHAVTVPMFMAGTCALLVAPFSGTWLLAIAVPAMILPVALQGRTHRLEATAPVPFRGPLDIVARLFFEQWVTFPRFVLGGGFARNWRASAGQGGRRPRPSADRAPP